MEPDPTDKAPAPHLDGETFLEAIIENIPDMLFVKDAKHLRWVRFNRAAEELLGINREQLIGKTDQDVFPEKEAAFFSAKDRAALETGKLVDVALETIQTKTNGERLLHTKKIPIFDEQGNPAYLLGISEDITEKKKMEARVAQADHLASIGSLAGGIAHDINNPLQGVLLNLSQLANMMRELPREQCGEEFVQTTEKLIDDAQKAAKRVSKIAADLISVSQRDEEKPNPVDVIPAIEGAINLTSNELNNRAHIQRNYGDIPKAMATDGGLARVFLNLIRNAVQAIDEGDPEKNFVRFETHAKDGYLHIEVTDSGQGMSPEQIKNAFESFYTTENNQLRLGLGLSVCKGIIEGFNGQIRATSDGNSGSKITVSLPVAKRETRTRGDSRRPI